MDPISVLRADIAKLKEKGYETLSVSELDAWIAQIPPANAQDRAFEEWKARAPLEHDRVGKVSQRHELVIDDARPIVADSFLRGWLEVVSRVAVVIGSASAVFFRSRSFTQ